MLQYLVKRILLMMFTLVLISVVIFTVIRIAPGSPSSIDPQSAGQMFPVDPAVKKMRAEMMGLDKPLPVQYWRWVRRMVTLDLGESLTMHRPVKDMIAERIGLTIKLNITADLLIYLAAIPLGLIAARNRYAGPVRRAIFDTTNGIVLLVLYSIPPIFLGTLLIVFFSEGGLLEGYFETHHPKLTWLILPISGDHSPDAGRLGLWAYLADSVRHLILPVITLTVPSLAYLSKLSRGTLLENLRQDFVRTARSKGLRERSVVYGHALRNSLLPMITVFASILPAVIGGSIIVETIFSLPGMGLLFWEAVTGRDYNMIQALSMITATMTLLAILVADILYAVVDPRIRYD